VAPYQRISRGTLRTAKLKEIVAGKRWLVRDGNFISIPTSSQVGGISQGYGPFNHTRRVGEDIRVYGVGVDFTVGRVLTVLMFFHKEEPEGVDGLQTTPSRSGATV